jgi:probable F420-dependent oxidoreductase
VQLSLGIPTFGEWAGGDLAPLLDLARAADTAGVDRLVVSDHVVLGRNLDAYRWGRFPTAPEGPWLEPLTCLTAFAAVTSQVRLSTGILIAPLRPAVLLAKTVATLDAVSGGRVDLGVGVGWQREEYDALAVDFARRGDLLEDTIAACRALWSDLPASYDGRHVAFTDVFCAPRPHQQRLPVWFSGTLTERTLRRVVDLGDGWIPIMGASVDDIRGGAERLRGATSRPLDVQAPLSPVRRDDKSLDIDATMRQVPELAAAGVSNVYLNAATIGRTAGEAVELLPDAVSAFIASRDAVPDRAPA